MQLVGVNVCGHDPAGHNPATITLAVTAGPLIVGFALEAMGALLADVGALPRRTRGRRLSVRGASGIIRVIAADANLDEEHITAHVGRHTFATTPVSAAAPTWSPSPTCSATPASTPFASTPAPAPPTANEPSISCHMTADQARWRYYTYLVATEQELRGT